MSETLKQLAENARGLASVFDPDSVIWPRPIPLSGWVVKRDEWVFVYVPKQNGAYGTWYKARWSGSIWTDDSRDNEELPTPSHVLPLPPKPE